MNTSQSYLQKFALKHLSAHIQRWGCTNKSLPVEELLERIRSQVRRRRERREEREHKCGLLFILSFNIMVIRVEQVRVLLDCLDHVEASSSLFILRNISI